MHWVKIQEIFSTFLYPVCQRRNYNELIGSIILQKTEFGPRKNIDLISTS